MPPPPSPPFELFDEQPCSARLPVRTVTDEFDFVHFVTLVEFKTLAQWVVPLDVFNPVAAAHIRASFPDVPLIRLRGGHRSTPTGIKSSNHTSKGERFRRAKASP